MSDKLSPQELEIGEWLRKAADDELSIRAILKENGAPSTACFLSQQIAEKILKAFLVDRKSWYPKIHAVDALWEMCRNIDEDLDAIKEESVYLTAYYVETRYPGDYPEFRVEEANKAFDAALRIKKFVLNKIGGKDAQGCD